jgi:hypothetical protein
MSLESRLLTLHGLPTRPVSATHEEWDAWHATYQQNSPIQYFCFYTLPRFIRRCSFFITDQFSGLVLRSLRQTHRVTINHPQFAVGHWHDRDELLLFASFQVLVDFVEYECGYYTTRYQTRGQRWYNWCHVNLPIIGQLLPPRRNALQGLHGLRADMKLTDAPHQVATARTIFKLYRWWKKERVNRIDPWTLTFKKKGSSEYNMASLKKAARLDAKYHKEDERMLCLLAKVRTCLWT